MEQMENIEQEKSLENIARKVAGALLKIEAVGFTPDNPRVFKSGIISPVYVDNRLLTSHPNEWEEIMNGFQELIKEKKLDFEAIAGIESAGISHSAVLGYVLKEPMVYIKKEVKGHGTKKRIEGGKVTGKKVLLLEDLVSTGGSSLSGVSALREEGAKVDDCVVIVSYDLTEARENFEKSGVNLHKLTTFPIILQEAIEMKIITEDEKKIIEDWYTDPWGLGKKHGFDKK